MKGYIVLDFETFSECDLKIAGGYEYARHPTTEIICAAARIATTKEGLRRAETVSFSTPLELKVLKNIIRNNSFSIVAHNSFFERQIILGVLGLNVPRNRFVCTASMARAMAIPGALEGAAKVLHLDVQKNMDGRRLILKWCKPKKASKKNPSLRHTDETEFQKIIDYCKTDVDVETELFIRLPELSPYERQVWLWDQKVNDRGFQVDRDLIKSVLRLIALEQEISERETRRISDGFIQSTNQRQKVLNWLFNQKVFLTNLRKQTVEDALKEGLATGDSKKILEYRLSTSKTSTAKYRSAEERSRTDGRIRDNFMYHAATTGRFGGVGFQPQNLKRSHLKYTDIEHVIETLKDKDRDETKLDYLRAIFDNPMGVFSSLTRSVILAPDGKKLQVADYAAIEARGVFWISKHEVGLETYRKGGKIYEALASKIYGVPLEEVTPDQRFVGKQAILGCGYGLGHKKFIHMCAGYGREISEELAKKTVNAYRREHYPVVKCWSNIEKAAIAAVDNVGKRFSINRTTWFKRGDFLFCELPSGRRLAYFGAIVRIGTTPWGEKKRMLFYYCMDSLTHQWGLTSNFGGGLVENVVQAVCRDMLVDSCLRLEATKKWDIVIHVHDEIVSETKDGDLDEFKKLMSTPPTWAADFPVAVEGWEGQRYRK